MRVSSGEMSTRVHVKWFCLVPTTLIATHVAEHQTTGHACMLDISRGHERQVDDNLNTCLLSSLQPHPTPPDCWEEHSPGVCLDPAGTWSQHQRLR